MYLTTRSLAHTQARDFTTLSSPKIEQAKPRQIQVEIAKQS